jgi:hypothetical protein
VNILEKAPPVLEIPAEVIWGEISKGGRDKGKRYEKVKKWKIRVKWKVKG